MMTYEEIYEEFSICDLNRKWLENLIKKGTPSTQQFALERKDDIEEYFIKLKKEYPDEYLLWKINGGRNENID